MDKGYLKTGAPTLEELQMLPGYPTRNRMEKGPVAVIECMQNIPCNPCEASCPTRAIVIGEDLSRRPILNEKKCIGCGKCIAACPGLAIFIVNLNYSETEALIQFPYELLPLPLENQVVDAVNREGVIITKGKVKRVDIKPSYHHTPIISLLIPKEYAEEVRGIARRKENGS